MRSSQYIGFYWVLRFFITKPLNNNEVLLRVTNHTGQAEKNLLGHAGIQTRDLIPGFESQ